MDLIIDQGNTNIKFYLFEENIILEKIILPISSVEYSFLRDYQIQKAIYSSVSGIKKDVLQYVCEKKVIIFDSTTKLPINNKYKSSTIGLDRLSGVTASSFIFPDTNVLVIDIGTAVTYDFINSKNEFLGGNISPGLNLRYKSLNSFTDNLPLIEAQDTVSLLGDSTPNAIISGVQNGLLFEINGYIEQLSRRYTSLKVILTGGDANFFVKKIKYTIFAEPNLIALGLNIILKHNT